MRIETFFQIMIWDSVIGMDLEKEIDAFYIPVNHVVIEDLRKVGHDIDMVIKKKLEKLTRKKLPSKTHLVEVGSPKSAEETKAFQSPDDKKSRRDWDVVDLELHRPKSMEMKKPLDTKKTADVFSTQGNENERNKSVDDESDIVEADELDISKDLKKQLQSQRSEEIESHILLEMSDGEVDQEKDTQVFSSIGFVTPKNIREKK